jgi:hypothetical protein
MFAYGKMGGRSSNEEFGPAAARNPMAGRVRSVEMKTEAGGVPLGMASHQQSFFEN